RRPLLAQETGALAGFAIFVIHDIVIDYFFETRDRRDPLFTPLAVSRPLIRLLLLFTFPLLRARTLFRPLAIFPYRLSC
ncbi:MAG: hypothetical protein ACREBQ_13805, partial [Nitrososphaerales archaeon]